MSAERSERFLAGTVLLFALAVPLSIAASQIALSLACVAWLGLPPARRIFPRWLWLAAAAYIVWTLVSAVAATVAEPGAGGDRWESLRDTKELLQFSVLLVVPPVARLVGGDVIRLALLCGATVGACWGLIDYAATPGGLTFRTSGPYGHYMTFGGVLMLVAVAVLGELAVRGRRAIPDPHVLARMLPLPLLLAALGASYSRNAWLGLIAGVATIMVVVRPVTLLLLPLLAGLAFALAPAAQRDRVLSIVDSNNPTNRERVYMASAGLSMIRERPLLGTGPNRVPAAYPRHRHADAPEGLSSHLHSNVLHIAAERGLPALLAWLGLLAVALKDGVGRWGDLAARRSVVGAWAAVAALFVAGLFEYNFGDSEVKMLFLCLLALPYGWARSEPAAA